jgi:hypothetical protein
MYFFQSKFISFSLKTRLPFYCRSSRRARTLESLSSLYVEEDVVKNLEESARLQRAYASYFDKIVVNENWEDTYLKIMNSLEDAEHDSTWVPAKWVYS